MRGILGGLLALIGIGAHDARLRITEAKAPRAQDYQRKNRGASSRRSFHNWLRAQNRRINLDRLALNRARRRAMA